ncbi:hypothetical protein FIBSPDRAFT_800969 [Athelia psychrophila]|uniref:DUF6534 domain-containing protein n=1 Tax=Athelia psychrophila TaxID=1759441 RepID=A0A165ZKG7_9AGAM|nr:hypothetical protein FIBSPDRAFT_800969 [Fibularhizoctonia sp. CBS 109695]
MMHIKQIWCSTDAGGLISLLPLSSHTAPSTSWTASRRQSDYHCGMSTTRAGGAWGFILIGSISSLVLFGICLAQVFMYCRNFKEDRLRVKVFVGFLVTLDALSTVLTTAWMYQLFVDGHGDIAGFETAGWLAASSDIMMGLIQGTVQLFFAWRLHIIGSALYPELTQPSSSAYAWRNYIVAKQHWLTGFICISSFATFCGGIGIGISFFFVKEYSHFARIAPIALTSGFSTMAADITITLAMSFHLHRAKGTFKSTDRLLDRLIQLTLQNGSLTTLVTLLNVCLYFAVKTPYWISGTLLLPKLYSNSALSSLNARRYLGLPVNLAVELRERSLVELRRQ